MQSKWSQVPLRELLKRVSRVENVVPDKQYEMLGAKWYAKGLYIKSIKSGVNIKAKKLYIVRERDFVYNRLFAWKGSFAIVPEELDGCYVSNEYPSFKIYEEKILPSYLMYYFTRSEGWNEALLLSKGVSSISRNRLKVENFLSMKIPLPSLEEQKHVIARIEHLMVRIEEARRLKAETVEDEEKIMQAALHKVFSMAEQKGWKWTKLESVAKINMGQSPPGESYNERGEGVPFLQGPAEFGKPFPNTKRWTAEPTKICEKGDILIAVRATVGELNLADKEYCIGRGIAAIRPNSSLNRDYLRYFLRGFKEEIRGKALGSTFRSITKKDLLELQVPLPSLKEQEEIVTYLDGISESMESLRLLQQGTEEELEKLAPAILDRVFKGEF